MAREAFVVSAMFACGPLRSTATSKLALERSETGTAADIVRERDVRVAASRIPTILKQRMCFERLIPNNALQINVVDEY